MTTIPPPEKIILHKKSRTLELVYAKDGCFIIPCAHLRAFSPSADTRYDTTRTPEHFAEVNILSIEPVGQYAIRPIFSDGHRTGIYSWQTLYELGQRYGSKFT